MSVSSYEACQADESPVGELPGVASGTLGPGCIRGDLLEIVRVLEEIC